MIQKPQESSAIMKIASALFAVVLVFAAYLLFLRGAMSEQSNLQSTLANMKKAAATSERSQEKKPALNKEAFEQIIDDAANSSGVSVVSVDSNSNRVVLSGRASDIADFANELQQNTASSKEQRLAVATLLSGKGGKATITLLRY